MYKVFLDIKYGINRKGHHPISIGAICENENTFYAEFNDFPRNDSTNNVNFIKSLKFDPPPPGQAEHWMHSKPNSYELRGDSKTIAKYLYDWLHSLIGGPVSWVDYSEDMGGDGYRNIKPLVDDTIIEVWTHNIPVVWRLFTGLWGGITDQFPKFVYPWAQDIFTIIRFNRHIPVLSASCSPVGGANSIKEWYHTFEDRR